MIRKVLALPLFWPCTTLALLIVLNASANPGFLALAWRDGHLYGNLIDILNRAAPLALVAAGMTLVIAARGLDISVGAVVAIAAATGALVRQRHRQPGARHRRGAGRCAPVRAVERARWSSWPACSPSSPR